MAVSFLKSSVEAITVHNVGSEPISDMILNPLISGSSIFGR